MVSLAKVWRSFTDLNNKLKNYLKNIDEQEVEARKDTSLCDAECQKRGEEVDQNLKSMLINLEKPINRMEKQLKEIQDGLQVKERIEILGWLSPIPYEQHHTQAHTGVLSGTGGWLLNDDRLLDWRKSSTSAIIWLNGIPGSGKTKLTFVNLFFLEMPMPHD